MQPHSQQIAIYQFVQFGIYQRIITLYANFINLILIFGINHLTYDNFRNFQTRDSKSSN